jgi:hypothetical protein
MSSNTPEKPSEPVKLSVQRRLDFIDFRLLWSGRFNRQDLTDTFQISPQQASADIGAYQERAPHNLDYDRALKTYVRAATFRPEFMQADTDRYLLQLVGIRSGWIRKEDSYFDALPPSEVVALERRRTGWEELQAVLDAIREGLEIEVAYNSITSPEKKNMRWLAPHAMVYSEGRWHLRAWSRERNEFRDFNLNRIDKVGERRPIKIDISLDYEWNTTFDLKLKPNPGLQEETRRAVEHEFMMVDGVLTKTIRLSHIFYLMIEHLLNIEPGKLSPNQQQLLPVNLDEALAEQKLARKMSAEALRRVMDPSGLPSE